jgi:hypothetical protein
MVSTGNVMSDDVSYLANQINQSVKQMTPPADELAGTLTENFCHFLARLLNAFCLPENGTI